MVLHRLGFVFLLLLSLCFRLGVNIGPKIFSQHLVMVVAHLRLLSLLAVAV